MITQRKGHPPTWLCQPTALPSGSPPGQPTNQPTLLPSGPPVLTHVLSVTSQPSSVMDWPPYPPAGQPPTKLTSLLTTQTAGQPTRQPSSLLMLQSSNQPTSQTIALLTSKPTPLPADQPLLILVIDTTMVNGPYHITHSRTYHILTHGI